MVEGLRKQHKMQKHIEICFISRGRYKLTIFNKKGETNDTRIVKTGTS
jgi:hypothetical protein